MILKIIRQFYQLDCLFYVLQVSLGFAGTVNETFLCMTEGEGREGAGRDRGNEWKSFSDVKAPFPLLTIRHFSSFFVPCIFRDNEKTRRKITRENFQGNIKHKEKKAKIELGTYRLVHFCCDIYQRTKEITYLVTLVALFEASIATIWYG